MKNFHRSSILSTLAAASMICRIADGAPAGFIDMPMAFDDVAEAKCGPEGDYKLVIEDVKTKENETGGLKGLLIVCKIESGPAGVKVDDLANVMHNISIPLPGEDQDKVKTKMLFMKRFLVHFKIPMKGSALNPLDFTGKRATCHLTVEDYEGTKSNRIKLPAIK